MIPAACDERQRFECRCHGSTFNIIGEKLERGPAPRGMDRFAVRWLAGGRLEVDTSEVLGGPPAGTVTFVDPHPKDEGCRPEAG
jgi:Rieske Fe-S protein